ncbi:MAG: carboxyl-terminal processing protease [Saprospiraceae bacterium]|jgi:carboxyl-terminal processing protease
MLQELKDGHVSIEPNFAEEDIKCGPPYEFDLAIEFGTEKQWAAFSAVMDKTLQDHGFLQVTKVNITEETNFQYHLSDSLGYLRINEMTEKLTFWKFNKALDKAVHKFQNKQGLIIDLRFNGGGWDFIAYQLASRLIQEEVGHYERMRKKGSTKFTTKKYKKIKPKGKNQFVKPIVILTSDFTASAAEVFLLLMKDLPHVTIIGAIQRREYFRICMNLVCRINGRFLYRINSFFQKEWSIMKE